MSGQTELQAMWLELVETLRLARGRLSEDEFEAWLAMLVILAARLARESLERDWRRAA